MIAGRDPAAIARVVNGLDRWFETMRVEWPTPGYGGPVVHWWNHSLVYRGTGLDWRYEGIIDGYLTLWRQSGNRSWLEKAQRAGDDLVAGQRSDGHFTNSRFELNPGNGGTPHEVSCDVALLLLARELTGTPAAARYFHAAQRNLERFAFEQLWHAPSTTFRDGLTGTSFVPNKAATFIEAVLLLSELTGATELLERYALPTGDRILALQIRQPGEWLDGAVAQNQIEQRVVESYFPIYIARCVPALLKLSAQTSDRRFHEGALAAVDFLVRVRDRDGGFPMVVYPRERHNRYPRWVAGAGDVVRAFDLARQAGASVESTSTIAWIVSGARPDGRIITAEGFGQIIPWVSRRERGIGETGVVGWCDKAFRCLAFHADLSRLDPPASSRSGHRGQTVEARCVVR